MCRAHPTPSRLRSVGRERHDAKEEPGPIRWALAGIDLSPAHLHPAVGAQRAKVALKFFLWQLQGRQRDGKRKKVKRKRKCILFYLTSASGIIVQKWRITISKSSLKIKGNKKPNRLRSVFLVLTTATG